MPEPRVDETPPPDISILLVHNARTTFVQDDIELLSRHFTVREWYVRSHFSFRFVGLIKEIRRAGAIYCWFASWHALLPVVLARLFNIPVVVVTGGYDTANVPEAGYGSQRGGLRRLVTNFILRAADLLVTNSHAACRETCAIPDIAAAKVHSVYHAVRPRAFVPPAGKERIALTVGGVWRENLLRKGLLPFVQAAKKLPEWKFILVGKWYDDGIDVLRKEAGENVLFTGFVDDDKLVEYYSRASVYVQFSLHEGFGLSVAEAMTAGCWPVVSNAGSLPEVVGDFGTIVNVSDASFLPEAIKTAHEFTNDQRYGGAKRVCNEFTMERREIELLALLSRTNRRARRPRGSR